MFVLANENELLKQILELNRENKKLKSRIKSMENIERPVDSQIAGQIFNELEKTNLTVLNIIDYIDTIRYSGTDNIYVEICKGIKKYCICESVCFFHTKIEDYSKLKHQSSFDSMTDMVNYFIDEPAYVGDTLPEYFSFRNSEYIIETIMKLENNGVKKLSNEILRLSQSNYSYYLLNVNGQVGEYYGYIVVKVSQLTDIVTKLADTFALLNRINSFILFNFKYIRYFNKLNEELASAVEIDAMTGIYNKGAMLKYGHELELNNVEFSIIALDVDKFKHVNDHYGHDVGDIVIIKIAEIFQKYCTRINGKAFRFGGDEFFGFIVSTEPRHIRDEVENFIQEVRDTEIVYNSQGDSLSVTLSVGVSCKYTCYDEAMKQADKNIYHVKEVLGRNNYYMTERKN